MTVAWPLYGHAASEQAFLAAVASGKLAHAWLIEGPSGIGKARFANRIGAYLLGAHGPPDRPLEATTSDPLIQKLLAGSHPDTKTLRRVLNDKGKLAQDISVDQMREFNSFFSFKPALGGWRIGIVDAVDDLNRNSANALLKTLEEPPDRVMILLVNHGTQPVLPTLRSRCRTLRLRPLGKDDMRRALLAAGASPDVPAAIHGRPGLALRLATPNAVAATRAARELIKTLPRRTDAATTAALRYAAADDDAFEAFRIELLDWMETRAEASPLASAAWLTTVRTLGEADRLSMDRSQTVARLIALLSDAAASA